MPGQRGRSGVDYTPGDGINLTVVLEGEDPDYGFSGVVLPTGWGSDFETVLDLATACAGWSLRQGCERR